MMGVFLEWLGFAIAAVIAIVCLALLHSGVTYIEKRGWLGKRRQRWHEGRR